MSTDDETNGITHQVNEIEAKAEQAQEIKDRIEREKKERQRAEWKNQAFKKLKRTIGDVGDERDRLADWAGLAQAMAVQFDENEMQSTLDSVEEELEEFAASDYDDYSDAAEINDLREDTLGSLREEVKQHADDLKSDVEQQCDSLEEEIKRTKTALRVPDLGDPGDMEQLEEILQFLRNVQQGELPRNAEQRWRRLEEEYEEIELSLDGVQTRFDLSDATIAVIRRFLDDETVMLSELDADVLDELQTFEEFSERLAVQFKEEA